MTDRQIIDTQLSFYQSGAAGCLFAAHAAMEPEKYGWQMSVAQGCGRSIEPYVQEAITRPDVSTQSIILPFVDDEEQLLEFLLDFENIPLVFLEKQAPFGDSVCLGYRVSIDSKISWVTGFGPFLFLPHTRQAPFTEIVFRTKPRPNYTEVIKEAPPNVIHLADMDMGNMKRSKFQALTDGSFTNTQKMIGHKPDLRSAAKTTFAVPMMLWEKLRVRRHLPFNDNARVEAFCECGQYI